MTIHNFDDDATATGSIFTECTNERFTHSAIYVPAQI